MKKISLFLLFILIFGVFTGCEIMDKITGKNNTDGSVNTENLSEIEEAVEEKDGEIEITVIPEDTDEDEEADLEDYFEIYVDGIKVRTFYRVGENQYSIGKISIRKGSFIYWKYYTDGVLVKTSDTVVLDGNNIKELIVLYLEILHIYFDGTYD